jgi:FdhD protein
MTTKNYDGKKYESGIDHSVSDALTIEEALQVDINGSSFTMTMRTPGDDEDLIRGLLHSEGVINNKSFNPDIELSRSNDAKTLATLTIPESKLGSGYTNSRTLLSVSSCGICGKTELEDLNCEDHLDDTLKIDISTVHDMFSRMSQFQSSFKESGGSHAAAAFNRDGKLIAVREDIGRHNAVDKIVGNLIRTENLNNAEIMTVSGRISYEIVVKCFKARIPVLAAVSAPSTLAVDYAKELGITLLAFCRKNRATCYSNTHRVDSTQLKNQAG